MANPFDITGISLWISAFVPIHQASLELFKVLSDSKARNYFLALGYIVYGTLEETTPGNLLKGVFSRQAVVPEGLAQKSAGWQEGKQARLVESFLLRSVGDDPVGEISQADVENVVAIARDAAAVDEQKVIQRLEILLARGTTAAADAASVLKDAHAQGRVGTRVKAWIRFLSSGGGAPVGVLLDGWRREFVEEFLPGEMRARLELGNALRAAEYRYHRTLATASTLLALGEAVVVSTNTASSISLGLIAFLLAFGTLLLVPKATNSLLEAIVGIGSRLAK